MIMVQIRLSVCLIHCTKYYVVNYVFFFQAEDGIRDLVRSRGLGDVYKRQRSPFLPEIRAQSSGLVVLGRSSCSLNSWRTEATRSSVQMPLAPPSIWRLIESFFDRIDHDWLMKFLEVRIGDPRVLRLIRKWLRAGVQEEGTRTETREGTPQGAVISPLLANVYLHYALDLGASRWEQDEAQGAMLMVRYADDVVVGFQSHRDAERFRAWLTERLGKFRLTLHPTKTRLIEFGRFAAARRAARGEGKPETFDFLGFTHICSKTKTHGWFTVRRQTMKKRLRAKIRQVCEAQMRHRHETLEKQGHWP